ncbi:uncharacterized protein LOC135164604 [Diachasmimorpha longicaudata]|uniref:uncharacterized protein LOC135164604 n=1 Tax=Diachasmimorpha longicaudata TaxID=58733 RepID=UPI0030B872C4
MKKRSQMAKATKRGGTAAGRARRSKKKGRKASSRTGRNLLEDGIQKTPTDHGGIHHCRKPKRGRSNSSRRETCLNEAPHRQRTSTKWQWRKRAIPLTRMGIWFM